ncbi:MAG: MFS transporter, partial [Limibacillus sp.]
PMLAQLGDPRGFDLFVISSIMVSFALIPVTLTRASAPVSDAQDPNGGEKRFSVRRLYRETPLGLVGLVLLSACQGAFMGLSPSFGEQMNLSGDWVAYLMTTAMVAGLVAQYPVGWLSDRFDRRLMIGVITLGGSAATGFFFMLSLAGPLSPELLLASAAVTGVAIFPLYAVLLAYTNDRLPVGVLADEAFRRRRILPLHGRNFGRHRALHLLSHDAPRCAHARGRTSLRLRRGHARHRAAQRGLRRLSDRSAG